jgi:adenylate cyclase
MDHSSKASGHRLAAVMFTDIVGYTAMMGRNEESALELLRKNRQIQKPLIEKYDGLLIKEMGDGILARFDSAYDAVCCAISIQ